MRFVGTGIGEDAAGSSSIHRRLTPPGEPRFEARRSRGERLQPTTAALAKKSVWNAL